MLLPIPPAEMMFMDKPENFEANGDMLLGNFYNSSIRSVLDIGCGYGRVAHALGRRGFRGAYLGLDVLPRCIEWLETNITTVLPSYKFRHIDVQNDRYNKDGRSAFSLGDVPFTPDWILLLSVFTHMYEKDILGYLDEIKKVMGERSTIYATMFFMGSTGARPYTFRCKVNDHCGYYSEEQPLLAIGYDEEWFRGIVEEMGFEVEIEYGFQDKVLLRV
jgi:SAM-dependent methyltransferase